MIERSWYEADGSPRGKWTYAYDAKGNKIEESSYKADGSIDGKVIYTYEYDSIGNWTTKTEANQVNKFGKLIIEPKSVTVRTITYYK
jgi:hypothetical protein